MEYDSFFQVNQFLCDRIPCVLADTGTNLCHIFLAPCMFVNSQYENVNLELLYMDLTKGNRFHLSSPAQELIKEYFDSNYRCLPPALKNTAIIVYVVIHFCAFAFTFTFLYVAKTFLHLLHCYCLTPIACPCSIAPA